MSQPTHMITPMSTMPTTAKTQTSASSLKREGLGSAGPVTITSSFMSGICRRNRKKPWLSANLKRRRWPKSRQGDSGKTIFLLKIPDSPDVRRGCRGRPASSPLSGQKPPCQLKVSAFSLSRSASTAQRIHPSAISSNVALWASSRVTTRSRSRPSAAIQRWVEPS
jgi:hypothetical protein